MFKEHKQLVEWATTEAKAENKKDKPEPNDTTGIQTNDIKNPAMIQVAGIYQLAPFLKDHHANLYQRSTLETLRAIVNAGRPKWNSWVKNYEAWIKAGKTTPTPLKPSLTAAEQAVHAVLRENPILFYHQHFNAKDFNLAGFDGTVLVLIGCDLEGAQLEAANLSNASLQSVNLQNANLFCAVLERSKMQKAKLDRAIMNHANISFAYLQGASLMGAKLDHADASLSNFQQVDIVNLSIEGTCFSNCNFFGALNLRHVKNLISDGDFLDSIVNEPNLVFNEDRLGFRRIIQRNGLSIADEQVQSSPHYETLKSAHLAAVQSLAAKGLTATTKASLEAEEANNV
jgi:hypothetical protein